MNICNFQFSFLYSFLFLSLQLMHWFQMALWNVLEAIKEWIQLIVKVSNAMFSSVWPALFFSDVCVWLCNFMRPCGPLRILMKASYFQGLTGTRFLFQALGLHCAINVPVHPCTFINIPSGLYKRIVNCEKKIPVGTKWLVQRGWAEVSTHHHPSTASENKCDLQQN